MPILSDTSLEAARVQSAVWRSMPAVERLRKGLLLSDSVNRRLLWGLRRRHPAIRNVEFHKVALQALHPRLLVPNSVLLHFAERAMPAGDLPASDQDELLQTIVTRLAESGIPFMVCGSVGANFYGEPRSTQDIDVVIDPTRDQLDAFVEDFDDRYYVSRDAVQSAWERRSMFNVIDLASGGKVDFIVKKSRAFSVEEFSRRVTIDYQGTALSIVTAEDAILSKLEWAHRGGSDRQLRDAESIATVQWPNLDVDYLRRWGSELGVLSQVEAVLATAEAEGGASTDMGASDGT